MTTFFSYFFKKVQVSLSLSLLLAQIEYSYLKIILLSYLRVYLYLNSRFTSKLVYQQFAVKFYQRKRMKSKCSKSTTTTPSNMTGMSSDVDDDQVLPDSLQKLEIVPVYPHSLVACKSNSDRNQNPFLTELSTANSVDDRVCIV